jgi:hypothetical protein
MPKVRIKLITIGGLPQHLDLKTVKSWMSNVFELVEDIDRYELRCDSDIRKGWIFSDRLISSRLPRQFDADFLLAIVNVPLQQGWFSRPVEDRKIIFSFHSIKDFLVAKNIPLENAILRFLYTYTLLSLRVGNQLPERKDWRRFNHVQTLGCLFDFNAFEAGITESCNRPIICTECLEYLRLDRVSEQTIANVLKEIGDIKKHFYYRVLDFVKDKPIIALIISSIYAVNLGVIGNYLYSLITS